MIKKISKFLSRLIYKIFELFAHGVEKRENVFITYHIRPRNSFAVSTCSDFKNSLKEFAIVVQGPIIKKDNFTVETVKLYKNHFKHSSIILSTWKDEKCDVVRRFKALDVSVVLNEKPAYAGMQNINLQIVSSRNGIKEAQLLGAKYVLKTRTDQRMYAPNVADHLFNITKVFPISTDGYKQKKRIVGVSLNTFKYRMYGLSDMLIYGYIDDMVLYWNANLDQRTFTNDQFKNVRTLKDVALLRLCEVYLATEFLKEIGRELKWTIQDSWKCFADHFCVIDKEQLDLFWCKYNRREYRWLNYTKEIENQEITFREWLNLYSMFIESNN